MLYSGNLCPDNAIFKYGNFIYCAVGDTYLQTNYRKGNGLYFGFGIVFLIVIIFTLNLKIRK